MRCVLGSFWNFLTVISCKEIMNLAIDIIELCVKFWNVKKESFIYPIQSHGHIYSFGFQLELYHLWLSEFLVAVIFFSDLCRWKNECYLKNVGWFFFFKDHIFQSIKPVGVKSHKGILVWKMSGQTGIEISKFQSNPESSWRILLLKLRN